jgi:hypothetical protein
VSVASGNRVDLRVRKAVLSGRVASVPALIVTADLVANGQKVPTVGRDARAARVLPVHAAKVLPTVLVAKAVLSVHAVKVDLIVRAASFRAIANRAVLRAVANVANGSLGVKAKAAAAESARTLANVRASGTAVHQVTVVSENRSAIARASASARRSAVAARENLSEIVRSVVSARHSETVPSAANARVLATASRPERGRLTLPRANARSVADREVQKVLAVRARDASLRETVVVAQSSAEIAAEAHGVLAHSMTSGCSPA